MSESIGKALKRIRESKKLSLEEVAEKTRIPKNTLSKIEDDRLGEIPSSFYSKIFVKSYSQFLNALEEDVVKVFLSGQEKKKETPASVVEKKSEPKKEPKKAILEKPLLEKIPIDWNALFDKYKKSAGIAIVAIFAMWFLFFTSVQISKFAKNVSRKRKLRAESGEVKEVSPAPVQEKVSKEASKKVAALPVELKIKARYNTWIEVIADGNLLFTGILGKGTEDTWDAKKNIKLQVGNAGGVSLVLNGKDLGYAGRRGQKKKLLISKDGIK